MELLKHHIQIQKVILALIFFELILINISFSFITNEWAKYYVISLITICITIFLAIKNLLIIRDENLKIDWLEIIWIIYILWIILANFITTGKLTINEIYFIIVLGLIMIVIRRLSLELGKERIMRYFIIIIGILGIFQSIVGLVQFLIPKMLFGSILYYSKTSVTGTTIYPNSFGSFIGISFICLLNIISNTKRKTLKLILIFLALLEIFIFIANRSRGAWFSFTASLIIMLYIYLFFTKSKEFTSRFFIFLNNKVYKITLFIFSFTILCYFLFFLYKLDTGSSSGRLMILKISYPMIIDRPFFGIGYNKFGYEYLNYQERFFNLANNECLSSKANDSIGPNNQYLKNIYESGLIGGIIFLFFCFVILKRIFLFYKNHNFQKTRYHFILSFIIIYIFCHCFFDDILDTIIISSLAFFSFALLPDNYVTIKYTLIRRYVFDLLIYFILGIILLNSFSFTKQYSAIRFERLGYYNLASGRYKEAENECRKALTEYPKLIECRSYLGRALIGQGKNEVGVQILKDIVGEYQSRDLYLALSWGSLKLGDYEKAAYYAKKVHDIFPDQERPILLLGIINACICNYNSCKLYLDKISNQKSIINNSETANIRKISQKTFNYINSIHNENEGSEIWVLDSILVKQIDSIMIAHY